MESTPQLSDNKIVIELKNISVAYDDKPALKNISLSIPASTIHVIIGPSGAGKTTLLKTINGLIRLKEGSITIFGEEMRESSLNKLRKHIGYIPQDMGLIPTYSTKDNVLMGDLPHLSPLDSLLKRFPKDAYTHARSLISDFALEAKTDTPVYKLSGGEKRRVAIARALMQKPYILLADEILSDLDFRQVEFITKKLARLTSEQNLTIIMVEHDLCMVQAIGNQITVLVNGMLMQTIRPDELESPTICKLFK